MSVAAAKFSCEQCGKTYAWKPELAGRKARCACGSVIAVPMSPPREEETYDLVDISVPPPQPSVAAAKPVQSLAYERADVRKTPADLAVEHYFPDRVKDLYLPASLIVGGLVIRIGYVLLFSPMRRFGIFMPLLREIGVGVLLNTVLKLIAILITAKARQINFGPIGTAIMKLCAISIAPGAIALLFAPIFLMLLPIGFLLLWAGEFCLYFAFLGALFDLDESDTWYCVAVIFIVNVAAFFALKAI